MPFHPQNFLLPWKQKVVATDESDSLEGAEQHEAETDFHGSSAPPIIRNSKNCTSPEGVSPSLREKKEVQAPRRPAPFHKTCLPVTRPGFCLKDLASLLFIRR